MQLATTSQFSHQFIHDVNSIKFNALMLLSCHVFDLAMDEAPSSSQHHILLLLASFFEKAIIDVHPKIGQQIFYKL